MEISRPGQGGTVSPEIFRYGCWSWGSSSIKSCFGQPLHQEIGFRGSKYPSSEVGRYLCTEAANHAEIPTHRTGVPPLERLQHFLPRFLPFLEFQWRYVEKIKVCLYGIGDLTEVFVASIISYMSNTFGPSSG